MRSVLMIAGGWWLGACGLAWGQTPIEIPVDLNCRFERVCREEAACTGGDLEARIEGLLMGYESQDNVVASVEVFAPGADTPFQGFQIGESLQLFGGGDVDLAILSVGRDGTARYTIHDPVGPVAVTHLGRCEGEPVWIR